MSPIRVLANPLAYRILTTVGCRGPQTTTELARVFRNAPTSSLYRQLARLRTAGVLCVVEERQARGAVERTYAVSSREGAAFAPRDLAAVPVSELRAALRNFVASMVADLSTYIESHAFARDRLQVNAVLAMRRLTDGEYLDTVRKVNAILMRPKARSAAGPAAKRRYFYVVALPDKAIP
ncbi:MAG TPA: helix-turn-helix domain-containing protein [Terriglobales bacterium]|nr:helix-turn-helix domain-containing protein [Terriglobales bacterium]